MLWSISSYVETFVCLSLLVLLKSVDHWMCPFKFDIYRGIFYLLNLNGLLALAYCIHYEVGYLHNALAGVFHTLC